MTEQQIPKLAGALVEHQAEFRALSVEDAQWFIQNTAAGIALCVEAIRNRYRINSGPYQWQTWKTIRLGVHKTAAAYRQALEDGGFRISDWALDILGKPQFTCAPEETEVELVVVTVAELGFQNVGTLKQIYAEAKKRGLELCHAEVGPALRLQYTDQPSSEWLIVAMEPIRGSDDYPYVFGVGRDDDQWLGARWGYPGGVWGADGRWLFRRKPARNATA